MMGYSWSGEIKIIREEVPIDGQTILRNSCRKSSTRSWISPGEFKAKAA